MKNKKNIITIIVAIVLLIGCLLLVLWKNNLISHGKQLQEDMFAIKDSSAVTKIFIADSLRRYPETTVAALIDKLVNR